jgi:hypothetical protein
MGYEEATTMAKEFAVEWAKAQKEQQKILAEQAQMEQSAQAGQQQFQAVMNEINNLK